MTAKPGRACGRPAPNAWVAFAHRIPNLTVRPCTGKGGIARSADTKVCRRMGLVVAGARVGRGSGEWRQCLLATGFVRSVAELVGAEAGVGGSVGLELEEGSSCQPIAPREAGSAAPSAPPANTRCLHRWRRRQRRDASAGNNVEELLCPVVRGVVRGSGPANVHAAVKSLFRLTSVVRRVVRLSPARSRRATAGSALTWRAGLRRREIDRLGQLRGQQVGQHRWPSW